jgi:hypothetical protein
MTLRICMISVWSSNTSRMFLSACVWAQGRWMFRVVSSCRFRTWGKRGRRIKGGSDSCELISRACARPGQGNLCSRTTEGDAIRHGATGMRHIYAAACFFVGSSQQTLCSRSWWATANSPMARRVSAGWPVALAARPGCY